MSQHPAPPPVAIEGGARRAALPDLHGRAMLTAILVASLVWTVLQINWSHGLLRTGGLAVLGDFARGIAHPDLSVETLRVMLRAAWITVAYAVSGMTLALAAGLPLGVFASGVLWTDARARRASIVAGRGLLGAMRAIHELVWAWLFVVAIGLSPWAAIFALAIPYAGILGRITADLLHDVPEGPLRALRATGAGEAKVLLYGRLPMAMPDLVSYSFYRFECAIRSSAIMGFVGLGGLGFQIEIALDGLHYDTVATHLAALIALVATIETWSHFVRREVAL